MRVHGGLLGAALAVLWLEALPVAVRGADAPVPSATAGALSAPVVLDVPFVPQGEALCGGAAAAMVLRYWGLRDVLPEDFASLVESEKGGIRAERLAAAVSERGFSAHVLAADAGTIDHHVARGRPPVLLLEVAPGRRHYVVVVAWTASRVLLHDPADRPFRVLSRRVLDAAWAKTGRLTLLIVPGARDPAAVPMPQERGPADDAPADPHAAFVAPGSGCAAMVKQAVALADTDDLGGAESRLTAAVEICPADARARRELAGVRFRQQRFGEAAAIAEASVLRDPKDALAVRLLATSRFLAGDEAGALAAWNTLGEPVVDLVSVEGLDRTRPAVVSARLGIAPRTQLVPQALRRAARRLGAMPTLSTARLRYEPLPRGRVEVKAATVERPLLPSPWALAAQLGADAATRREARIGLASLAGEGGWLEAGGRWWENRPAAWLSWSAPGALKLPGIVRLEALFDEQRYAAVPGGLPFVERRRRASVGVGDWLSADLHAGATLAVERERATGTAAIVGLSLDRRLAADRAAILIALSGGLRPGGGDDFGGVDVRLALRSTAAPERTLRLTGRAGLAALTPHAPLACWPGAGTGTGRDLLLRAHPLLSGGVVAGEAFGRRLLHGGAELDARVVRLGPVVLGAAAFADLARAWERPGRPGATPLLVDVGAGLRLRVPGAGELRVDWADGARGSGRSTLSAGWVAAWPR